MQRRVLMVMVVLGLGLPVHADEGPAAVLTSLLTAELDSREALSVLSSADVRQALALEAQKQSMGCDSESCLAEIAGAMGVDYVVHGQLGRLERSQVLTLTLFDARSASSAARTVLRGESVDALASQLPQAVDRFVAAMPGLSAASDRKVLVMDLRAAGVTAPEVASARSETDAAADFPLLPVLGGGVLALGALTALGGGVFGVLAMQAHARAEAADTLQVDAATQYDARDLQAQIANILYGTGGVVAAVGAGVLIFGLAGGE